MKEINEAFEVLGNEKKRKNYDRYGTANEAFFNRNSSSFESSSFGFNDSSSSFFEQILDNFIFSGTRRGNHETSSFYEIREDNEPKNGEDLFFNLYLTSSEVNSGVKKKISFKFKKVCEKCQNKNRDYSYKKCTKCQGVGVITRTIKTIFGITRLQSTCSSCLGTGKIKIDCEYCLGKKITIKKKEVTIHIPKNTKSGNRLRYKEIGNDGLYGGKRGDVYITVKIK